LSTPEFRVARVPAPALYELRRRVLRGDDPASNVEEPRDVDSTSLHFGGFLDDVLVVSASFYRVASPTDPDLVSYQLRFMATDVHAQGRGYGALVMAEARNVLLEAGAQELWANARDTALGFYVATGWTIVEGSEHLSPETQLPHTIIVMRLEGSDAVTS
jgi:GNAT superfamily N-acetyltransferase